MTDPSLPSPQTTGRPHAGLLRAGLLPPPGDRGRVPLCSQRLPRAALSGHHGHRAHQGTEDIQCYSSLDKGQDTLCVQTAQYRMRSSKTAFLRTVLVSGSVRVFPIS